MGTLSRRATRSNCPTSRFMGAASPRSLSSSAPPRQFVERRRENSERRAQLVSCIGGELTLHREALFQAVERPLCPLIEALSDNTK